MQIKWRQVPQIQCQKSHRETGKDYANLIYIAPKDRFPTGDQLICQIEDVSNINSNIFTVYFKGDIVVKLSPWFCG